MWPYYNYLTKEGDLRSLSTEIEGQRPIREDRELSAHLPHRVRTPPQENGTGRPPRDHHCECYVTVHSDHVTVCIRRLWPLVWPLTQEKRSSKCAGVLCVWRMLCGRCTMEPLNSGHPWGTTFWPGWPSLGGCFVHKRFFWDLGPDRYIAVGLFSGVAVKRGSFPL